MTPTSLDLFSGIGGPALGFYRAGIKTTAFCEIEPHARSILALRWPGVPIFEDVRTLNAKQLLDAGIALPDIITGGFPCTNISPLGNKAGIVEGEESRLWFENLRLIDEIKPACVVSENVVDLRSRGLEEVLRSLDAIGYDAEWHCIRARRVGLRQRRDRIWIISYPNVQPRLCGAAADQGGGVGGEGAGAAQSGIPVAGLGGSAGRPPVLTHLPEDVELLPEPGIRRVANGIPSIMDRLERLGNASVPQISELIGRAVVAQLKARVV